MEKIINVTGGKGGNAFLIRGENKNALFDCGMAYCEAQLISNIKNELRESDLDLIFISHSHYDHVGAIPYLKKEWPQCRVLGARHAEQILIRPNALKKIKELGQQAATFYGVNKIIEYDDRLMQVDDILKEGDLMNLGKMKVRVLETKGHTQCSLSFLLDDKILFASESTGYMSQSGTVYPAFITSSAEALTSIDKCKKVKHQFIVSPHYGLVKETDTFDYWKKCTIAVDETKKFVLALFEQGYAEDFILSEYEKVFRDAQSRLEQPDLAFRINAQNMIKVLLNEKR